MSKELGGEFQPDNIVLLADIPYYKPKDEEEEKQLFLEAIRLNPRSCPPDQCVIIDTKDPTLRYFVPSSAQYSLEDAKNLAILGDGDKLFKKYRKDIEREFPDFENNSKID